MSFSFDASLPTGKDSVRSILRDVDEATAVLTDEEILANLANNGWNDGLGLCATSMAAEFARRASAYKAGSTDAEFNWAERVSWYKQVAEEARRGAYPPPSAMPRTVSTAEAAGYGRKLERELLGWSWRC
jgi:hypothetical protein